MKVISTVRASRASLPNHCLRCLVSGYVECHYGVQSKLDFEVAKSDIGKYAAKRT